MHTRNEFRRAADDQSRHSIEAHVLHTANGDSSAPTFLLPAANQHFVGTWADT